MLRNLALLLIFTTPCLLAEQVTDNVQIPQGVSLTYQGQQDGTYRFKGQLQLTGILVARWGKDLTQNNSTKKVYLQFLPEQKQTILMPTINDQYKDSNQMITLNNNETQATNTKLIKQTFKNIPEAFWANQEDILQQPVKITLNHFQATDDCDYRYYYGKIEKIQAINTTVNGISTHKGCNSYIFDDNYLIHSQEGYTNLRAEPNGKANILKKLPNDTLVNKIKTVGKWYYINVLDAGEKTNSYGYIHQSQVIIAD